MSDKNKQDLARLLQDMADGAPESSLIDDAPTPPHAPSPTLPTAPTAAASNRDASPPHFARSLALKRTIIPILLTLGILCPSVGLLGFAVGPLSSYYQFRDPWFCIPLCCVGLVMLVFAAATMIQVRLRQKESINSGEPM